jgi:hypothetical protein
VGSGTLSIYEFSRQLIETKDLDPVYVAVWETQLEPELLKRWLLAYWCFYHVGTAAWIAEANVGYWRRMQEAAASKEYPRSSERRHFRGSAAIEAVLWLKRRGIQQLFEGLQGSLTINQVMEYVQTWNQFGPWIAFKVVDMIERLNLAQVTFDLGSMFLFDSPREGAILMWDIEGVGQKAPHHVGNWAVESILSRLSGVLAPPRYEREVNVQEAETCLCKWYSYMRGGYYIGKDIEEIHSGLMKFPLCKVSQRLLQGGIQGRIW